MSDLQQQSAKSLILCSKSNNLSPKMNCLKLETSKFRQLYKTKEFGMKIALSIYSIG